MFYLFYSTSRERAGEEKLYFSSIFRLLSDCLGAGDCGGCCVATVLSISWFFLLLCYELNEATSFSEDWEIGGIYMERIEGTMRTCSKEKAEADDKEKEGPSLILIMYREDIPTTTTCGYTSLSSTVTPEPVRLLAELIVCQVYLSWCSPT